MESVRKLQYSKYACTHRVSASRPFLYFVHCAKQRLRACQEYQYHQHQPATSNPLTRQRGEGSLKTESHYLKHALPLITLSAVGLSLLDMAQSAQIKNVKDCHLCNLQWLFAELDAHCHPFSFSWDYDCKLLVSPSALFSMLCMTRKLDVKPNSRRARMAFVSLVCSFGGEVQVRRRPPSQAVNVVSRSKKCWKNPPPMLEDSPDHPFLAMNILSASLQKNQDILLAGKSQ